MRNEKSWDHSAIWVADSVELTQFALSLSPLPLSLSLWLMCLLLFRLLPSHTIFSPESSLTLAPHFRPSLRELHFFAFPLLLFPTSSRASLAISRFSSLSILRFSSLSQQQHKFKYYQIFNVQRNQVPHCNCSPLSDSVHQFPRRRPRIWWQVRTFQPFPLFSLQPSSPSLNYSWRKRRKKGRRKKERRKREVFSSHTVELIFLLSLSSFLFVSFLSIDIKSVEESEKFEKISEKKLKRC